MLSQMLAGEGEDKFPIVFVLCREKRKKFSLFRQLRAPPPEEPVSRDTTKPLQFHCFEDAIADRFS
jgi:hypothetical protein